MNEVHRSCCWSCVQSVTWRRFWVVVGPPPQGLLWMHHGHGCPCPQAALAQGTWLGGGEKWPLVCAQGALLKVPVLPCKKGAQAVARGCSPGEDEADFARSKFSRWCLSSPCSHCHRFAESWCSPSLLLRVPYGAWRELVDVLGPGAAEDLHLQRRGEGQMLLTCSGIWPNHRHSPLPKSLSDSLIS